MDNDAEKTTTMQHHADGAAASTLYTIGHGAKDIDEFIAELRSFKIQYLVDIRSKPYSKWYPCYSQPALKEEMRQAGITYVYMGDSIGGLPDDTSCYPNGYVDYTILSKKEYFVKGINRLVTANNKGLRLAIMCSEADPSMCHRSKLVGEVLRHQGININHIVGMNKQESQLSVIKSLNGGYEPEDLFGYVSTSHSRKKYER